MTVEWIGWRVKTTSSSVILRKDGMSIHIR